MLNHSLQSENLSQDQRDSESLSQSRQPEVGSELNPEKDTWQAVKTRGQDRCELS